MPTRWPVPRPDEGRSSAAAGGSGGVAIGCSCRVDLLCRPAEQSGLNSPGVQTLDIEASAAQAVNEPGCHRTGLDAHFGVDTGMFRNASRNWPGISGADAAPKPPALLVDNADRGRLLRHVLPNIMRHRNLRWCKPPGNLPGSRHYRLLGFAPRLPEVHTIKAVICRF